jgi:hypothetical protein
MTDLADRRNLMTQTKQGIAPTSESQSGHDALEEAVRNLDRMNFWINNCDTKLAAIVAFHGLLLAGMIVAAATVRGAIVGLGNLGWLLGIPLAAYGALAFLSLLRCAIGLTPDIKPRRTDKYKGAELLFFGAVASSKLEDYVEAFGALSTEERLRGYCHQIHTNASIAQVKFRHAAVAVSLAQWVLLFWSIIIIVSYCLK